MCSYEKENEGMEESKYRNVPDLLFQPQALSISIPL